MEMSYLRGACVVTRWDGESNESMYERCGMESHVNEVNCGMVEWVKRNTFRWLGRTERMGSEEFVKKLYMSESVGPNSRGRPLQRWRDRVKEYLCERGATRGVGLDQAKRECLDRERRRFFCRGQPCGGRSWREQGIEATVKAPILRISPSHFMHSRCCSLSLSEPHPRLQASHSHT